MGPLVFDTSGHLYGTAYADGGHNYGAVFELIQEAGGGWSEKVLHSFDGIDGWLPSGGVIFDAAGNLYGTTQQGGSGQCDLHSPHVTGCGTVFELSPQEDGSWTFTTLHNFNDDGADGIRPLAGLIFDKAGNLYGTTYEGGAACFTVGCGTIFELSPATGGSWTEKILHSFSGRDGVAPYDSLIFDAVGNLYGTTLAGGAFKAGTVFELIPKGTTGWTESVLYDFNSGSGEPQGAASPYASLVFDAAGNLYGTTFEGGSNHTGAVFELTHNSDGSWTETVLHYFTTRSDGQFPAAGLIFGTNGDLYGTTEGGGSANGGVVFALRRNASGGWTEAILHSFGADGPDAGSPSGSLILDSSGNLYGLASFGIDNGNLGAAYEVKP